jgi:two-component system sensor histidine kinase DesK
MARLTGWWDRKSNAVKVEVYTRWSLHLFTVAEISLVILFMKPPTAGPVERWLLVPVIVHGVLCSVLQSKALDWRLRGRPRPVRLALAVGVLSAAGALAAVVLHRTGELTGDWSALIMVFAFLSFGSAAISLTLPPELRWYAALGAGVLVALAAAPTDLPHSLFVATGCVAGSGVGCVLTYHFSAWQLDAVWELDAARTLQARLAVAEERLRFGRDLHDVMGRNLAVIALKSELAVQLAERGRPEAVAQMVEVQRIARESQREVRDVVRGYREANLHTELEGARGVLAAAGIDCRIDGDDGGGLSAQVQSALAWVVREATTNVLRHGDARRCTVRLSEAEGGEAVLVVENDGVPAADGVREGAAGAASATRGSGLAGLRERLSVLGGTLEAGRTRGARFRLTARVPLPAASTASAGAEAEPGAGAGARSGSGSEAVA